MDSIINWINNLEAASDPTSLPKPAPSLPSQAASRKRKTISNYSLASPPLSYTGGDDNIMTSTPQKRRRMQSQDGLPDPDATPRPGARSIPSSAASISGSETSSLSRSSSVKGQMMRLRMSGTGVETKSLNEDTVPAVAKPLFLTMAEIERGLNILPAALRNIIRDDQGLSQDDFESQWQYSFKSANKPDHLPGRIPSIVQIKIILARTTKCENGKLDEASWNTMVHWPLLSLIFEDDFGEQCSDFNTIPCPTARPHRAYTPGLSSARMVDLCIYATLNQYPELDTAINAFTDTTATHSVNHTDYYGLQFTPLIISIETKQPGGGEWDRAQLQMGVWHAAQWNFLRSGVEQKLRTQRPAQDDETFKAETLSALSKLGFIPGIFVNGSRWHLVISTYDDGKTTLWAEWVFGATKSLMKIFAVIAGVRELTAWGRDQYLPWFKENVLTVEED
ncbi:hypothetical protein Trisim1_002980 [Trichoderma cf. simile WF8]